MKETFTETDNSSRKVFDMFSNQSKHLYELSLRKEKYSEYLEKNSATDIVASLWEEVIELLKELDKYEKGLSSKVDKSKIQWELKDVIFMLNSSMVKMEQLWLLEGFEGFWKEQKEKIFSRAPHLKKSEKIPLETERKVWKILKEKE